MEGKVTGTGTIRFYWTVSLYQYLRFYIDGQLQEEVWGPQGGMGVIHIGFLSSKKIFSPDRNFRPSPLAASFRFPSVVCGFAARH